MNDWIDPLAAAAPQLLAALERLYEIRAKQWRKESEIAFVQGQMLLPWPELQQAEAAIAKARGRA